MDRKNNNKQDNKTIKKYKRSEINFDEDENDKNLANVSNKSNLK